MRKFNIFLARAFLFTSCVVDDLQYIENGPRDIESGIKIFGTVQDFDVKKVTTRADEGSSELPSDSFISEMTMFVFKGNGEIVQGYRSRTVKKYDDKNNAEEVEYVNSDECSSAINLQKANPTFLIDTQDGLIASLEGDNPTVIFYDHQATDLDKCKIYIVANAWHVLEGELDRIKTLSDLEAITLDIDDSLSMPMKEDGHYRGFPMIGTHRKFANNEGADTFDLSKTGENKAGAVAKIPLKKLYSKVSFTIQVNANEVVSTPRFRIEKAEVFNVPSKARLGRELDTNGKPAYGNTNVDDYIIEMVGTGAYEPNDYYHFTESPKELPTTSFSRTEIQHTTSKKLTEGSEYLIEFSFYMPEHKVTPNANSQTFRGYPTNIDEDLKQYYKPDLVGAVRNGDGTTTNEKFATFVRIHGKYYDHNGQIKNVRYDIYLGQNNTDDFTVKRNQLLTNKLVITGLTNYHDAYGDDPAAAGNISIDHRVDVDYAGFNLSMERTAILDSHFEVRPLDIELSPGSTMTITIPEGYRDWVGMESDVARYAEDGRYVSTGNRKAVRKYFTTGLVSELNGGSKEYQGDNTTITARGSSIRIEYSSAAQGTKIFRIWFYIDENPNVYDKLLGEDTSVGGITSSPSDGYEVYGVKATNAKYRNCPVQFKYIGTDHDAPVGGNATISKTVTINFQQWNLWRVWSADGKRYYDIEHEEEYLNNYASDVQYGGTQNGMPYGLEGVQLSNKVLAYWLEKVEHKTGATGLDAVINWIVSGLDGLLNISNSSESIFANSGKEPYYDFYLSRDGFPTDKLDSSADKTEYARDYQGLQFNKEIAATLKASTDPKAKIDGIILTEDPKSAFAYCYHKNKRNNSGQVVDQKWFLPAIDEIEDIALGAYDEFDQVFQNQKYWSCQPAYERNLIVIEPASSNIDYYKYNTLEGNFFNDNTSRARATSIYTDGSGYSNIMSSIPDNVESGKLTSRVNVKVSIGWSGITVTQTGDPITDWDSSVVDYSDPVFANPNGEYRGNSPRTEKCRIRAVYRSGTK